MKWRSWVGPLCVLAVFGVPLFIGLGQWDLRNDESIYSYAVDRMVETGDWITPRAIPFDNPFLEKPPLKFWLVSAAIRAGLLPKNEVGFRALDALFGACAFLYVYALGRRLASEAALPPVAATAGGLASVLTLFTIDPLLFDHGLRSNNMEATLLLAYCGGIYHFARWVDGAGDAGGGTAEARRRRLAQASIVGAYFALGFMAKFVAMLFFPIVCAIAFLWRRDAWTRLRAAWPDWLWAALLSLALIVPWFVLAWMRHGEMLWQIMFGVHVFTRFTGALDPQHLHGWTYYYTETWIHLRQAGSAWLVLIGLVLLAARAWQGRSWLARLLLVWWLVPTALMSGVTSKLFHYAYPFLPPLAIGAGLIAAQLAALVDVGASALPQSSPSSTPPCTRLGRIVRAGRPVWLCVGAVSLIIAAWNLAAGSVHWFVGNVEVFRNSSTFRPLAAGTILLWIGGRPRLAARALGLLAIAALLPVSTYRVRAERLTTVDHPLRAMRDCTIGVQASHAQRTGTGVYNAAAAVAHHAYNYYFGRIGPWTLAARPSREELLRRLFARGHQTPVVLSTQEYYDSLLLTAPDPPAPGQQPISIGGSVPAVIPEDGLVVLLPGPYAGCADAAVAAGGRRADDVTRTRGRQASE